MDDQKELMKDDGKGNMLIFLLVSFTEDTESPFWLIYFEGWTFLTPVVGFYCQKCEEFIGDLTNAENHAATHRTVNRFLQTT